MFESRYRSLGGRVSTGEIGIALYKKKGEPSEEKYKTMLYEIDSQKEETETRIANIKVLLQNMEQNTHDQGLQFISKLFIHEISAIKNLEYDLNTIVTVL